MQKSNKMEVKFNPVDFKESDDDPIILAKEMKITAEKYKDKILTVFAIYNNKKN